MKKPALIIGGICLTGKTTLAKRLIEAGLEANYVEGDDLHTSSSITSMTFGMALQDEDRIVWRERIGAIIQKREEDKVTIITCSALTRAFRDEMRSYGELRFVFLTFCRESAERRSKKRLRDDWQRLQSEPGYRPHYFQPAIYPELLDGQYRDLQIPGARDTPGQPETDCFVVELDRFPSGTWGPDTDYDHLAPKILEWFCSS